MENLFLRSAKKNKQKNSAIVLFQVFVPDEKKNKCQKHVQHLQSSARLAWHLQLFARAATCTCGACGAFPPARIFVLP